MSYIFRTIWPITDEHTVWSTLRRQAESELPTIAARSHATLTGPGRFYVTDSQHVPGSGRITPQVLVYEAPAQATPRRLPNISAKERTYDSRDHRPCPRCGVVRDARPESWCRDCREVEGVA